MKKSSSGLTQLELIHADPWFIALHKEPGIPCQSRNTSSPEPLDRSVERYLNEPLRLWTRIDQPVSGIVLFYRNQFPNGPNKMRILKKTYLAIVEGHPPARQTITTNLVRDGRSKKSKVDDQRGKVAELSYHVVHEFERYTLVSVIPRTGRFHQIRHQLAHIGFPVKGDVKYGARRKNPDRSIHLHAFEYVVQNGRDVPISVTDYAFPADPLWDLSTPYIRDWVNSDNH